VPINKIKEFEKQYIELLELKHKDTMNVLADGKLTDEAINVLKKVAIELTETYK
jgi:F-type H+/Na+-transporting ATPase subunit alpha